MSFQGVVKSLLSALCRQLIGYDQYSRFVESLYVKASISKEEQNEHHTA
jgi:hypothetical protein